MGLLADLFAKIRTHPQRLDRICGLSSRGTITDGPGEAMLLAHNGDGAAYRAVLRWSAQWLRTYFEYYGPSLSQRETEAAINEIMSAVHAKRHTFLGDCPYAKWLEAITDHKAPRFLGYCPAGADGLPKQGVDFLDFARGDRAISAVA
jgi:hypothetical protein